MKLKYVVGFSIMVFFVFVTYFFVAGMLQNTATQNASEFSTDAPLASQSVVEQSSMSAGKAVILTTDEISRHTSEDSCWLLISNKVYDVTEFIDEHPGGAREIIPNCGKEATEAFRTQDGEGQHSSTAQTMLQSYYIGDLGQTLAPTSGQ